VKKESAQSKGLHLLIEHYRSIFRIPENLYYYSEKDFITAERNFIKIALQDGKR
jgi:hypothetical protein